MAKPSKTLRHNILIVCEGESTGPQYFSSLISLAKKAWGDNPELFIEISPKPRLVEESIAKGRDSKHKTARKKRQLKTVSIEPPLIEGEFKAVPVRYVREAQQGLEDGTYEETWAVFDKDYHPKHKEAFELSEEEVAGKKVQIAFSSISFEQWILLHFEKNFTAFGKSATLIEHLQTINPELQDYSKRVAATDFMFLHLHHLTAFENAAWLRFQYSISNSDLPIYERNPYTNIDGLVKHLLQIREQILWIALEEIRTFAGMTIQFSKISATLVELRLTNNGSISYIFLPNQLYTISNETPSFLTDVRSIISVGETITIPIANVSPINFFLNVGKGYRLIVNS